MAANDDILDAIQADIAAFLRESPMIGGVTVLVDGDKDFTSRLEKELGPLRQGATGKRGIVLIVAPVEVEQVEENLPGPVGTLVCRVIALEAISINRNPRIGTRVSSSKAAIKALRALHLRSFGSHVLFGGKSPIRSNDVPDGVSSHIARLTVQWKNDAPVKVSQITASATGDSITLQCLTPDSAIRYTTDGSFPTALSSLYSEPIAPQIGTVVRAIAYAHGFEPSDVLQFTVRS